MKKINMFFFILLFVLLNSCASENEKIKHKKTLIVQEMDTTHTVILSDRPPYDLNSYLSYVRHIIYSNTRHYIYTRKTKIDGYVDVSFRILSSGNVQILRLSGTDSLYATTSTIMKKSFPIYPTSDAIKASLPVRVKIRLNYMLNKNTD